MLRHYFARRGGWWQRQL